MSPLSQNGQSGNGQSGNGQSEHSYFNSGYSGQSVSEYVERLREDGSADERKRFMEHMRFIGYGAAQKVLGRLERILAYPKQTRMPCLLIGALSGNGKTTIAKRFLEKHPKDPNPDGEAMRLPVIHMDAPPRPIESRFYNNLLREMNAPFKANDRINRKEAQALKLMEATGVKMLMIDEIQHFSNGSEKQERTMLNTVKTFSNQLDLPIVALGTAKSLNTIESDPQIKSRFEIAAIPRWTMNMKFRGLLKGFERLLPLRKESGLYKSKNIDVAREILALSEGTINEIKLVLEQAAIRAIDSGEERITLGLLQELGYVKPSEENRGAAELIRLGEDPGA